jgi:hypothetical protein
VGLCVCRGGGGFTASVYTGCACMQAQGCHKACTARPAHASTGMPQDLHRPPSACPSNGGDSHAREHKQEIPMQVQPTGYKAVSHKIHVQRGPGSRQLAPHGQGCGRCSSRPHTAKTCSGAQQQQKNDNKACIEKQYRRALDVASAVLCGCISLVQIISTQAQHTHTPQCDLHIGTQASTATGWRSKGFGKAVYPTVSTAKGTCVTSVYLGEPLLAYAVVRRVVQPAVTSEARAKVKDTKQKVPAHPPPPPQPPSSCQQHMNSHDTTP